MTKNQENSVTYFEKSIPLKLINERWELSHGLMHCKVHNTYFATQEEPCWQCYYEVQEEEA